MCPSRRLSKKATANSAVERMKVVKVSHLAPRCMAQAFSISPRYPSMIHPSMPQDQISEVNLPLSYTNISPSRALSCM